MIVYKVVDKYTTKLGIQYTSARYGIGSEVTYKMNQWNEPVLKGTAIFTFKDINQARDFKTNKEAILECEIRSVMKYTLSYKFNYHEFIKLKRQKKKYTHLCIRVDRIPYSLPYGTILVSAIKPLREIQ